MFKKKIIGIATVDRSSSQFTLLEAFSAKRHPV